MGTMLDQAELRGEKRGMEKQRKLDEAELKAKDDEIAKLKAKIAEMKLK